MVKNTSGKIEVSMIVLLACIPLFIHLPYRVNIFLSWEGAYRMSEGQLPFRDFGIPLGGMYWVIPAIFFKLLGPKMITLLKAQVFINVIAGLSFRSILKSLSVDKGVRLAAVLVFCLSYSFFNFWPWYNHSVIVYELMALACLCRYIHADMDGGAAFTRDGWYRWAWLVGGGVLTVCSFLTKQDGGGLGFMLACMLLAVYGLFARKWRPLLIFVVSFAGLLALIILPFLKYGFGYWFNHGQAPHTARVSVFDVAEEFFAASQWIKFYLFIICMLAMIRWRNREALLSDKKGVLLTVLTLGLLGEAAIFQITSYTPPDNNIFFHSFGFACILSLLGGAGVGVNFTKPRFQLVLTAGVILWWSSTWWKYTERFAGAIMPHREERVSPTGENVVNRSTYMINPDTSGRTNDIPTDKWIECGLSSFDRITMPAPTVDGIHRLLEMDLVKKPGLHVLNMSELTPLAAEIPFELERNPRLPLWYHLGVGMFNRQADSFGVRIRQRYYNLILFEYIPTLNNFYPFRLRDSLHLYYRQVDSFMAPRRGPETKGVIEVFFKPTDTVTAVR